MIVLGKTAGTLKRGSLVALIHEAQPGRPKE
jgi:hypothetical protein